MLVNKTFLKKHYPNEEADPMFVAKAGKFITQPAMGKTA